MPGGFEYKEMEIHSAYLLDRAHDCLCCTLRYWPPQRAAQITLVQGMFLFLACGFFFVAVLVCCVNI